MWRWLTRIINHEGGIKAPAAGAAGFLSSAPTIQTRQLEIAEVEIIGSAAVATLTVTEVCGLGSAELLADLLEVLAATGATNFILDVQNVHQMDSAALGVLVHAVQKIERNAGRIALVNPDRTLSYLFRLTRLDRVFPICTDVMSALAAVERTSRLGRAV